jgi:hypothetical protein
MSDLLSSTAPDVRTTGRKEVRESLGRRGGLLPFPRTGSVLVRWGHPIPKALGRQSEYARQSATKRVTVVTIEERLILQVANHAVLFGTTPDNRGSVTLAVNLNPDQQFLIKPEPDLSPLRDWILNRLSRRPERWQDLHAAVRSEWWLPKHVNELVRELKKEGAITADEIPGRRFGAAANPVLRLPKQKT